MNDNETNLVSDKSIIMDEYTKLKNYESELKLIERKLEIAMDYCNKNNFSIDGVGYDRNIEACYESLKKLEKEIKEFNEKLLGEVNTDLSNNKEL